MTHNYEEDLANLKSDLELALIDFLTVNEDDEYAVAHFTSGDFKGYLDIFDEILHFVFKDIEESELDIVSDIIGEIQIKNIEIRGVSDFEAIISGKGIKASVCYPLISNCIIHTKAPRNQYLRKDLNNIRFNE